MSSAKSAKIQKHMYFSSELVEIIEEEGQIYGLPFNQFVQHILLSRAEAFKRRSTVDYTRAKRLRDGGKEHMKGVLPKLGTEEDIDEYFDQI